MIMHLRPEFIKIDLSLIRKIGKSILKRELVKDFFWNLSLLNSYDSDPPAGGDAEKNDLTLNASLGYSF